MTQPTDKTKRLAAILAVTLVVLAGVLAYRFVDRNEQASRPVPAVRRPLPHAPQRTTNRLAGKIRHEGDRQYLWAKGPTDPEDESSEWFDLTGSPLPLEGFQYGIGKDTIPSIDHPVFVKADDPRLKAKWGDLDLDNLTVIGFVHNGIARAYPVPLLNRHELVNDTVGGKPVTVGW